MILGAQANWTARTEWTIDKLAKRFRNQLFKVGDDDDDNDVEIKMKYFIEYMNKTKDDSPLYLFDSKFAEHPVKKSLLKDYTIPKFFPDDLLKMTGEKLRPPYRWFLIGPPRSGTAIHIDPLATSAWNALVFGHKRWVLFPPDTPKELVSIPKKEKDIHRNEGITWFTKVYPKTLLPSWPRKYSPVEVVQNAGEVIFVPGGWWHVVLNLDYTVAVTQNFCSRTNFPIVWHTTGKERPKLAKRWLEILWRKIPSLARLATLIDLDQPSGVHPDSVEVSEEDSMEDDDDDEEDYSKDIEDKSSEEMEDGKMMMEKRSTKNEGDPTLTITTDRTETATAHKENGKHNKQQEQTSATTSTSTESSAEREKNMSEMCGKESVLCETLWGIEHEASKRVFTEL